MNKTPSIAGTLGASTAFVALVLGALVYFDVDEQVRELLIWLEAQGAWAALLFILLMTAVVVLLLPGVMFTTGAGFVFGVIEGSLWVVIGTTAGATIAFLIARRLFGARARGFVTRHARLQLVTEELAPHGWKIVMLTRLVPFFPFKLSNYFFGLTAVSLRGFIGGTLIGTIPFSVHNVYLGAIAAELASGGARHAGYGPLEWVLYGAGFAAALAGVVYFSRVARRALARYEGGEARGEDQPCPG